MLIHHEEFGDRLLGVLAGYLIYAGLVAEGPHAVVVIEKITGRQLGSPAREIVAVTVDEGILEPRPPCRDAAARSLTMGTIVITGLRELGVHGVLPEEQTRPAAVRGRRRARASTCPRRARPTRSTTPSTTRRWRRR